jgi:hypothetical protein
MQGQMRQHAQLEAQLYQQDEEDEEEAAAEGSPGRGLFDEQRLAAELSPEELAALKEAQAELLRAAEEEEEQERLWMEQQQQQQQQQQQGQGAAQAAADRAAA